MENGGRRLKAEDGGPKTEERKSEDKDMIIQNAKELEVYQIAYALAMRAFELSKNFPQEERYALTSQIRRSSRSVCLNLREAWLRPVEVN